MRGCKLLRLGQFPDLVPGLHQAFHASNQRPYSGFMPIPSDSIANAATQPKPPQWLEPDDFERVIRLTPLISIDLIVRSPDRRVLLGRRTHEPARNTLFTVGGRIGKDETRAAAFERIVFDELGVRKQIKAGRFHGVYEHFYPANFFRKPGFGTHYIVLAYELPLAVPLEGLPRDQHRDFVWKTEAELLACPEVHDYVKNYFRKPE